MEDMDNKITNDESWLQRLSARSWEMELLIVGFALLILHNVPDILDKKIIIWQSTITSDFVNIFIYFARVSIIGSNILMLNLVVHVILRGFWIGIVGLNSVYPKGINYENLNLNNKFKKFIQKKVQHLEKFTVTVDNISSSIFAFTFLLIFIFISVSLYFIILFLVLILLADRVADFIPEAYQMAYSISVILIIAVPYFTAGLVTALDFLGLGFLKKIKSNWFQKVHFKISRIIRILTLSFTYESIYYTLISNMSKKIIGIILVGYIGIGSFLLLTDYSEFIFFDRNKTEYKMSYINYENENGEINRIIRPTIQSNIIEEGYLKIFIPYNIKDNELFQKSYPEIEPFRKSGLKSNFHISFSDDDSVQIKPIPDIERSKLILESFKDFYLISIDDSVYSDFEFSFYSHPNNKEPGLFTVLFIDDLKRGKHLLSFRKNIPEKNSEAENEPYYIPFWVK